MDERSFPTGTIATRSAGEAIGSFVRERRRARGWTQQELADLVGVGRRFIVDVERGKPTVQIHLVDRVTSFFGKRVGLVDLERGEGIAGRDE